VDNKSERNELIENEKNQLFILYMHRKQLGCASWQYKSTETFVWVCLYPFISRPIFQTTVHSLTCDVYAFQQDFCSLLGWCNYILPITICNIRHGFAHVFQHFFFCRFFFTS